MEVTRKNFNSVLPLIKDSVEKADFLVIDAEFTGLNKGRDVTMFDTPTEYYKTVLSGSSEFLLIQYGLCAFHWDKEKKQYCNEAYNFYLFPRGRPGPEKIFLCQSSSLDFLASQGFDFNKVIKDGISYMTDPEECKQRKYLTQKQKATVNNVDIITIPDENRQFVEDICQKVRTFIDEQKTDEMEIDRCNAFIRRLLFQELGIRFKEDVYVETKVLENKDRVLRVVRLNSASHAKSWNTQKKEKEWEELEEAVGFSKVARMISQSGKLVIGHNMLLDVIHTLNHFFEPLPPDYESFKEFAHCMFPKLLDTKFMSSLSPFKEFITSSVLQHLFSTLSEPPFSLVVVESAERRGYSCVDDKPHEAGFDAYVTGLCFLAMHAHLANAGAVRGDSVHTHRVDASDSTLLKPFLNKLFLAKTAHQDQPYMNLDGPDPTPSRDHVFYLIFPKEWQRNDINQLFSPFGQVIVQFLNDTSALIALSRRDQVNDVIRGLKNNGRVQLIPYIKYKRMLKEREAAWWKDNKAAILVNTSDTSQKTRQVYASSNVSSPAAKPPLPVKVDRTRSYSVTSSTKLNLSQSNNGTSSTDCVQRDDVTSPTKYERTRSNSGSSPTSPAQPARKRSSSGVFQVDEAVPPPVKKKGSEVVAHGTQKSETEIEKTIEKEVIQKFDDKVKSKCVTAFKESDSWD